MELKGSKTEQNLMAAFAGESQARNKYTYYAQKAREEGMEQIARIFEETARNEQEHAKLWFKALHGDAMPDTAANLEDAAAGENYEWTDMYKHMAETAREEGFQKIHDYMVNHMKEDGDVYDMCMGGFILRNTLSDNGTVTRGVCTLDGDGSLKEVTETYEIRMEADGSMKAQDEQGNPVQVNPDQHVSMNMWGLPAAFLKELEKGFPEFLENLKEGDIKSEYLLPKIIDKLVKAGKARVEVLETKDKWFGVTYKEDKETVVEAIRSLIAEGAYPERLY